MGVDVTGTEKVWRAFQALGDIAFAYSFSNVLIEIQVSFQSRNGWNFSFDCGPKKLSLRCQPKKVFRVMLLIFPLSSE